MMRNSFCDYNSAPTISTELVLLGLARLLNVFLGIKLKKVSRIPDNKSRPPYGP